MRDTIFLGHATEARGPVPANDPTFYTADVTPHAFDPEKAKALLEEAGFKAGADGKRFTLKLLPAPHFTETRQLGDYLRQALAVVGIEATIVAHDAPGHLKAVYTDHNFDLAVAPLVFRADPAISTTNLVRSGLPAGVNFSNRGAYLNAELDTIIDTALTTLDPAKRVALYHRFQQLVTEDLPLINVVDWTFTSVASTKLSGIATNPRWAVSNWAELALARGEPMTTVLRLVVLRLIGSIPVLLIVLAGVFAPLEAAGDDAIDAYLASIGGGDATLAAQLRADHGLDQSALQRFLFLLLHLVQGDPG